MLLTIRHITTYRFATPVTLLPHRIMLAPRGQHDLSVRSRTLEITPPAQIAWTQDVFGNLIATAHFTDPADRLTIASHLVVDQSAPDFPIFTIDPAAHNYPFAYSDQDIIDLGALAVPEHDDPHGTLDRWIRVFIYSDPTDTLSLLKDINAGLLGQIAYRWRDEEGTQTPQQTLDLASGSCRDLATLFIEGVRRLGFGARAVSGYLYDPASDQPGGADQHGATHAWAEVYLPCAGWIAFDPANRQMGGANLIPVAVARNIAQIRPVAGSYAGRAEDSLDMVVDVTVTSAVDGAAHEG